MKDRISIPAQKALSCLHRAGFEAWIVGGCVRDLLLGRTPTDYDLTTNALPDAIKSVFNGERVIETGIAHGTVTVILYGEPLEITTYRVDGAYSDTRHPDGVAFSSSLREDANRRDFTVNAMAWNVEDGLKDYFGGQEDLNRHIIRCVGDPERRFREDALRILRALRFSSVLNFSIEHSTLSAARTQSPLLKKISVERVYSELTKILCGPGAGRIVKLCPDILGVILPELPRDLEGTVRRLDAVPPVPHLRWAALLWETEKPGDIFRRLHSDRKIREQVEVLVQNRIRPIPERDGEILRILGEMGETLFFDWLSLRRAESVEKDSSNYTKNEGVDPVEIRAKTLLSQPHCLHIRDLAVRGGDLLALGFRGADIGKAQNWLLGQVMEGNLSNERETLLQGLAKFDSKSGR